MRFSKHSAFLIFLKHIMLYDYRRSENIKVGQRFPPENANSSVLLLPSREYYNLITHIVAKQLISD